MQQLIDYCMLEGSGQILRRQRLPLLLQVVAGVDKGRLEAGEAEVVFARRVRTGQFQRLRIAALRHFIQQRAAGIGQMQYARRLVKGFACRIILRAAKQLIHAVILYHQDVAVTAAGNQAHKGRLKGFVRQIIGADMAFDVVDGDQRLVQRVRQRLGAAHARQQRANQARAVGDSQRIDVIKGHAGFLQRLIHHAVHRIYMRAAGNFRHHAAVNGMQGNLREDGV